MLSLWSGRSGKAEARMCVREGSACVGPPGVWLGREPLFLVDWFKQIPMLAPKGGLKKPDAGPKRWSQKIRWLPQKVVPKNPMLAPKGGPKNYDAGPRLATNTLDQWTH